MNISDALIDAPIHEEPGRISLLLGGVSRGDPGALGEVFHATYSELCAIARARLRGAKAAGLGLDTHGLVHEVFMRLSARGELHARNRGHFFKYAGLAMRSVLVDEARQRTALRRGGGADHADLSREQMPLSPSDAALVRVPEVLEELSRGEPELVEVVQMRFFAGLTDAEMAQALGVSERTIRRRWERARALLAERLG